MVVASIAVFVISLLIGGLGIYVGGRVVTGVEDYSHAIITALIGSIIWAITGFFIGWIPLLGPIIVFVAYLAVINWRYPGGWVDALLITLGAWITVLAVMYVLAFLDVLTFEAVGVPGV